MITRRVLLAAPALLPRPARAGAPARVVVAGGGIAEIVCALGARGRLVGVDSTSLFPAALTTLPQIGYLRSLSAEGVLSLRPDLLLLAHEAGPPATIAQLRAAGGAEILQLPRIHDPASLLEVIGVIATALDSPERGARMMGDVAADFAALEAQRPRPARPPRALFVLSTGSGAPMAAGSNTSAAAMFALAGISNVITGYEGYRAVSPEAALAAAPDWLVAPRHAVEARGGASAFLAQPQLALLPAARQGRLYTDDSLYLLGFGPRTAHAARDLSAALHAPLPMAALPERPWLRDAA